MADLPILIPVSLRILDAFTCVSAIIAVIFVEFVAGVERAG